MQHWLEGIGPAGRRRRRKEEEEEELGFKNSVRSFVQGDVDDKALFLLEILLLLVYKSIFRSGVG